MSAFDKNAVSLYCTAGKVHLPSIENPSSMSSKLVMEERDGGAFLSSRDLFFRPECNLSLNFGIRKFCAVVVYHVIIVENGHG